MTSLAQHVCFEKLFSDKSTCNIDKDINNSIFVLALIVLY